MPLLFLRAVNIKTISEFKEVRTYPFDNSGEWAFIL